MKKGNVAVFIPHLGCPHDCVFCDQRWISGTLSAPDAKGVRKLLTEALAAREKARSHVPCEIAFFGGSFTAIPRDYMVALLDVANEFSDHFNGIRVSTRPDCVDDEVLDILARKGVTDIELGVQSMDDRVLALSGRGHTAEDTLRASDLIRQHGIGLGHQMMTGLPGDTPEGIRFTAKKIAEISPDTVRIYPTLVISGTGLERLYKDGIYQPQTLEETVESCAELIAFFEKNRIRVIRVGLHADGIGSSLVAGPFHPAFGELCENRLYEQAAVAAIEKTTSFTGILGVAPGELSKMIGQQRRNVIKLSRRYGVTCTVKEVPGLSPRQVVAE